MEKISQFFYPESILSRVKLLKNIYYCHQVSIISIKTNRIRIVKSDFHIITMIVLQNVYSLKTKFHHVQLAS